ncbi:hypothetical protein IWQ55_006639 [Labrenzia sp. EL_208]|nr:hypothetical protein [Labrenzia sp. EL_132]MBG6233397.1 hypothetical protein [Labrenzia sp. EL_208]
MADGDKEQSEALNSKLDRFSEIMGVDGMAVRREYLELAIRSGLEGDPIDIANRFLDYVIGDHVGPNCELLTNKVVSPNGGETSSQH